MNLGDSFELVTALDCVSFDRNATFSFVDMKGHESPERFQAKIPSVHMIFEAVTADEIDKFARELEIIVLTMNPWNGRESDCVRCKEKKFHSKTTPIQISFEYS